QTEQLHRRIDSSLDRIAQTMADPDYVKLAQALRVFADSEGVRPGRTRVQRIWGNVELWSLRTFVRNQRLITIAMLVLLALNSLSSLTSFTIALALPLAAPELARSIQSLYNSVGLNAFSPLLLSVSNIDLILDAITAIITFTGIILFLARRRRQGLFWIHLGLLLQLCVVNVFTFYNEQFSAALIALANLAVLLIVRVYQHNLLQATLARRHLAQMANPIPTPQPAGDANGSAAGSLNRTNS
ncbi:MAG TPA: hypothetical protein VGK81_07935, partial [Anaerolineae bacterium]